MVGILLLFILLSMRSNTDLLKYPPLANCKFIEDQFKNSKDYFEKYAAFDKAPTLEAHGMGQYQCFC